MDGKKTVWPEKSEGPLSYEQLQLRLNQKEQQKKRHAKQLVVPGGTQR